MENIPVNAGVQIVFGKTGNIIGDVLKGSSKSKKLGAQVVNKIGEATTKDLLKKKRKN